MKRIISNIVKASLLCLTVMGVFACQKPFEMKKDLSVDRDEFYVSSAAGSKSFTVWANGGWTAELEKPVTWASIEKVTSGSISGVRVTYQENTAISRAVNIIIKSGKFEKRVYFAQKAGMSNAMLAFDKTSISLLKTGLDLTVSGITNLSGEDLSNAEIDIRYTTEGDNGGWIRDFHLDGANAVFSVSDNDFNDDRSAVITVDVPGAYPGEGAGSSITVNQSKEDVSVKFITGDVSVSGMAESFAFAYSVNFDADVYRDYTLKYGFADAQGKDVDWVKNIVLKSNALEGRTRVNQGSPREATAYIEVLKNGASVKKVTAKLSQAHTDAELVDGGSEEQIKDTPEDF